MEAEPEMDAVEGTRNKYSNPKWMLEPEINALCEQGMNDTTIR